jgi:hypothetical protein
LQVRLIYSVTQERLKIVAKKFISTQDFQAFVELVGGKVIRWPLNNSSRILVEVQLTETVRMEVEATAILRTEAGEFFGRNDEYNFVRVPQVMEQGWVDGNYALFGQGARLYSNTQKALELLSLL